MTDSMLRHRLPTYADNRIIHYYPDIPHLCNYNYTMDDFGNSIYVDDWDFPLGFHWSDYVHGEFYHVNSRMEILQ